MSRSAEKASASLSFLQRNIIVAFTVALLCIIAIGLLQLHTARRLHQDNEWVSHSQLVLRILGAIRTRLERADASAQSFVITGNASYLTAYNQAISDMFSQVQNLRQLTSDNPNEQQRIDRLQPLLSNTFGAIQKEIDARGADVLRAEALLPLENSVRQANADANGLLSEMANEEVDLLNQRNTAAQQSNHRANLLILFSGLTALALVAAAGIVLYRDSTRRVHAEESRGRALADVQAANLKLAAEIAERTEAQRRLRDSETSLRELSVHLLRTQDEERRRIGRELHDSVGQHLAALKLELGAVLEHVPAELATKIASCISTADQSIAEVRTMSYLLHPPLLDELGLREVVPWYVDGFAQRSGIATTLEMTPEFPRLPSDVELVIVRVLQESLTNVHRHSGSRSAQVRLRAEGDAITLEVQDQGKGFPVPLPSGSLADLPGPWGVGLRSISERAKNLHGKLEILSSERGSTIRITLPSAPVPAATT